LLCPDIKEFFNMAKQNTPSRYVITDSDEGVQINEGIRLGFAGSGYELDGFSEVVKILDKLFPGKINIAASSQSDWIKEKLELKDWDEINAMAQQHIQALADQEKLLYTGFLEFEDPKELEFGIKGHMVRPKGMHLANKICFTLGGGEQVYNLGQYLISADWVNEAKKPLVEKVIKQQVEFYQKISKVPLKLVAQKGGVLGEEVAEKNRKVLEKIGVKLESVE